MSDGTEITTELLGADTLWEIHGAVLEDQERAYRNWYALKEKFGEESEMARAACEIHDATAELRSAMLDQMEKYEVDKDQTEAVQ